MHTVIHAYKFDTSKPAEGESYGALRTKLEGMGLKCFETLSAGKGHYEHVKAIDGQAIALETEHLFDNQWNTAPIAGQSDKGLRVFDWAQDYLPMNKKIKRGHWLEQTADMREVRRNTMKCGYCGKQEAAAKGYVFCPHCIDSEYLKEGELKLTRMRPVDRSGPGGDFPELTEAEKAHLLPLYREAQLHGTTERGKARIAKARHDVAADYAKVIRNATVERDGKVWILDRLPNVASNMIYYSHTGRWGFGWRTPCDAAMTSALLDIISEFPFPYDIKTTDGRTLSGD